MIIKYIAIDFIKKLDIVIYISIFINCTYYILYGNSFKSIRNGIIVYLPVPFKFFHEACLWFSSKKVFFVTISTTYVKITSEEGLPRGQS